mmetsp:Transcript_29674/g.62404  ORF Transcript_29674/g.62404 Transcript_29674/m.62404 type:complete len:172 (+) Transcript_29674:696-1211(+)
MHAVGSHPRQALSPLLARGGPARGEGSGAAVPGVAWPWPSPPRSRPRLVPCAPLARGICLSSAAQRVGRLLARASSACARSLPLSVSLSLPSHCLSHGLSNASPPCERGPFRSLAPTPRRIASCPSDQRAHARLVVSLWCLGPLANAAARTRITSLCIRALSAAHMETGPP